ncbi:PREDICTED: keratin-associated protein 10-7-like [Polistes canadensis]|uniref:keratin-associated protein 10-7-like n=1 Tax=Polistes canadensis TaxID=91411 RepID=UPI000718B8D4|nr:PREDICTED: keratin-associated protein 10-7-like [Polistes canadensis]
MPCDGKNPNCDRRRELLAQLKCLISSMDRKKPCEWDEPPCPPPVNCPVMNSCDPCCEPVKRCKSYDLRASIMHRCECIRRNGLQDRCMMWDCMGRPECLTKLYPVCGPGACALLKLTDLGDVNVALRKFFCTNQARESALAAYCRLVCNSPCPSICPPQLCVSPYPSFCPPCITCCSPCTPCDPCDPCEPCVSYPPLCPPPYLSSCLPYMPSCATC